MRFPVCLLASTLALSCSLPLASQISFTGTTYPAPSFGQVRSAVADLDRDGNPDIVTTSLSQQAILIRYGTGNGGFGAPQKIHFSSDVWDVKAADFNNDGNIDLAVSSQHGQCVYVLTNHGNHTYSTQSFSVPGIPTELALGDFNGDGKIDLAVDLGGAIQIYLGKGDGTFTSGFAASASANTRLYAMDVNKDGKLDLVAIAPSGASILLGNGDGTFTTAQSLHLPLMGDMYNDGAVADLNGDAAPDLVLTAYLSSTKNESILSYLNDGKGHFTLKQQLSPPSGFAFLLALGDINYDGKSDLVYVDTQLAYALGNGDGTFQAPKLYAPVSNSQNLLLRDLNNDGQLDVIDTEGDSLRIFRNTTVTPDCASPNSSKLAVHVCLPAVGATVGSPFSVRAVANAPTSVLRIEEWLDGKKVSQQLSNQVRYSLAASAGTHTLTVVAVDLYGRSIKQNQTITVDTSVCTAPSAAGVRLCSPANGATVSSPVAFTAAATPANNTSLTAMRLYVDNIAQYTSKGNELSTSLVLSSGSHSISVVGYEANGAALRSTEMINVH